MTTFVLAPSRAWSAATSAYRTPRVMLEQALLRAYTQRDNETLRHLELAPVGSSRRDAAEWINEQVEDDLAVKAVARELHVSVATVRRFMLSLELTEQIEAGEWEGLSFDQSGEPVWDEDYEAVTLADEEADEAVLIGRRTIQTLGDQCEPAGTTDEELGAALEASVHYTLAGPGSRAMNNPH